MVGYGYRFLFSCGPSLYEVEHLISHKINSFQNKLEKRERSASQLKNLAIHTMQRVENELQDGSSEP